MCNFVSGHLHMFAMKRFLVIKILNFRVKLLVSTAINMIDKDDFSKLVQAQSNSHMIWQCLSPMWEFLLRESQTWSCENKLVVVVVKTQPIHEVDDIIEKSKIHAGNQEALSLLRCGLLLSLHKPTKL